MNDLDESSNDDCKKNTTSSSMIRSSWYDWSSFTSPSTTITSNGSTSGCSINSTASSSTTTSSRCASCNGNDTEQLPVVNKAKQDCKKQGEEKNSSSVLNRKKCGASHSYYSTMESQQQQHQKQQQQYQRGGGGGVHYGNEFRSKQTDQPCCHPKSSNNSKVLGFAFYSFFIFTCVQAFYAIQSHSSSLLADTAAMFVDAGTYLFNMLAETFKDKMNENMSDPDDGIVKTISSASSTAETTTKSKLQNLYLELLPPFVSIVALLNITCMSLLDAIGTLYHHYCISHVTTTQHQEDDGDDDEPNVKIMMIFAIVALVIDLLNVSSFSRAARGAAAAAATTIRAAETTGDCEDGECATATETTGTLPTTELTPLIMVTYPPEQGQGQGQGQEQEQQGQEAISTITSSSTSSSSRSTDSSLFSSYQQPQQKPQSNTFEKDIFHTKNMNMYSAWTHVFADTLRSTAILLAGIMAHFYPNIILPVISDAIAAIVVSLTIFFSCIPLVKGLNQTWHGICILKRLEKETIQQQQSCFCSMHDFSCC